MTIYDALWLAVMLIGFIGSALYSGMETGVYVLNRVRVRIHALKGNRAAQTLQRLIAQPTNLLTTLLIGNNVMNYMGTAATAVLLEHAGLTDGQTIAANALIVTPILFVFGETLPKDMFAAHADRFMYRLAPVLDGSRRLFTWTGLLPLIAATIRKLIQHLAREHRITAWHPRRHMSQLVHEGVGEGVISVEQSVIVQRVIALSHRTVGNEMTPWTRTITVPRNADATTLRRLVDTTGRSRFVVLDDAGEPIGVIHAVEALLQGAAIDDLIESLPRFDRACSLRDVLSALQPEHAAMAIITDRDKPVGIVTLKDLVEPITGELTVW
jgi:CBS domain containing-hemolysin-like protein